jgi:anti-anti-sigma factor
VNPDTPSATYYSSCRLARAGSGSKSSVVWLGGEHDVATKDVLVATLAEAAALDELAVVIDLSGVHFISATAIGVIMGAKELLARRGRSLVLRAPPPSVRRVFDACGLSGLLDGAPSAEVLETVEGSAALRSWVEVPATGRVDWHETCVTAESNVDEQASVEFARDEQAPFVKIP